MTKCKAIVSGHQIMAAANKDDSMANVMLAAANLETLKWAVLYIVKKRSGIEKLGMARVKTTSEVE